MVKPTCSSKAIVAVTKGRFDFAALVCVPWHRILPGHLYGILGKYLVGSNQYSVFGDSLGNQQPVEWIFVMCGQISQRKNVWHRDG